MEFLTPSENAAYAVEFDPVRLAEEQRRSSDDWRACQRLWKIVVLSPTIEICEALLRGEAVPHERLDPAWLAAFGLRNPEAA